MKKQWINFALGIVGIIFAALFGQVIAITGAWAFGIIPLILGSLVLGYFIFKNPFFGFLLIVFFLPFERVPTLDMGGINIKINTILGFLTIFAWVLASMFNGKRWKIQQNALAVPLSLFVIALLISLTQALNFGRGIQVLVFSLFTVALSIMTVNMIPNMDNLKKVVWVLLISGTAVSIFGLFQFGGDVVGLPHSLTLLKKGYGSAVFGFPRIQAFSMEPLYFANYLLIPMSLAMAYYFAKIDFIKHWWLIGILALFLVNFVLTVSRGGYLGLVVALLVFVIFYFKQVFTWKNISIVLVLAVVALGVAFALSKGEYRATSEFINHALVKDAKQGESVQGRLNTFDFALGALNRYPVFGIGIGNYGPYSLNYPPQAPESGWPIVNNEFIEILVETGVVGAIAYGLILLVLIYRSVVAIKYVKDDFLKATLIGLLAAFIGVMVQYNFFSTLYIIHIWVLIGLLVAVQNLAFKNLKS